MGHSFGNVLVDTLNLSTDAPLRVRTFTVISVNKKIILKKSGGSHPDALHGITEHNRQRFHGLKRHFYYGNLGGVTAKQLGKYCIIGKPRGCNGKRGRTLNHL